MKGDLKRKLQNSSIDMKNTMDSAYEVKRKEITENYVPEKYLYNLTEAEVVRAQKAGLIIGAVALVAVFIYIVWWLL